jgi:hypothetical protein
MTKQFKPLMYDGVIKENYPKGECLVCKNPEVGKGAHWSSEKGMICVDCYGVFLATEENRIKEKQDD